MPSAEGTAGHRVVVGVLVVGPPTAVLGVVLAASALHLSAPASALLVGTAVGAPALVLRAAAVLLLVAAALGVHDVLLRRGVRPAVAAAVVVLGAAPLGGLALVEPLPTAVVTGLVAVLGAGPVLRRHRTRAGSTARSVLGVTALLVGAGVLVAWATDELMPAGGVVGSVAEVGRSVAALGAGWTGPALPLLVLAGVLSRGQARLLLLLLAGGVGLLAALTG